MTIRVTSLLVLLSLLTGLVAGCAQPAPMAPAESAAPAASDAAGSTADAAAPGTVQPGGTWTQVTIADASIINPILSSDSASSAIEAMVFPGLIGQDRVTGEFTPDGSMSESWTVSADGLTWTFKLREGITWSDGDPVDAADFKFTYDAIASDLVETVRKELVLWPLPLRTPVHGAGTFAGSRFVVSTAGMLEEWDPITRAPAL